MTDDTSAAVEKKVKKSLKAKKPKVAEATATTPAKKKKKVKEVKPVQDEGNKVAKKKIKKTKGLTKKKAKLAAKQIEKVAEVKAPKVLRHVVLADTTLQVKISDSTNTQDSSFASLSKRGVSEQSLNAVEEMDLKYMSDAQHKIIYPLLKGRDLLVRSGAEDGGKQLALLLHAVEIVQKLKMTPQHGTGALFVVPNGEYALQMISLLKELMENHTQTIGMVVSGKDHAQEVKKLTSGVNILIATPGRLLNHLQNTPQFQHRNLQYLVLINADEIVQLGLEEEMVKAIGFFPTRRQSVACTSDVKSTENLVKLVLKKLPLYIDDIAVSDPAKPDDAELSYLVCPSQKRLVYLQSILRRNKSRKIIVYFSSSMSAQFHEELLEHLNIRSSAIHGLLKQSERSEVFLQFCNDKTGILLCTELAARGFNMPQVDMIIHYDQPSCTGVVWDRAVEAKDELLLFLHPDEVSFLTDVGLSSRQMQMSHVTNVETQIVELLNTVYSLHITAREAYKSYIGAYASHCLNNIFDVSKLDLEKVAAGFGFAPPPFVELNIHI